MDTMLAVQEARVITDSDLVSQTNQEKLIFWMDVFRAGQFDIGDIAIEEITRNAQRHKPATQERVFKAVGRFCGKTSRTVRYYYETALFYPESVRREFNMLPFSHFVFARYLGSTWRECLEWASLQPDCTEKRLRFEFIPPFRGCQETENYSEEMDEIENPAHALMRESTENAQVETCETSHDNERMQEAARGLKVMEQHFAMMVVDGVLRALDKLVELILSSQVDSFVRTEVMEATEKLRKLLPKLV